MNAKTLFAGTSIALALTAAAATPANAAITTFATISALTADNVYLKNTSSNGKSFGFYSIHTPTSTTPGSVSVKFSFINEGPALDAAVSSVNAIFTLNATESGTAASSIAGYTIQPSIIGSFSLISTTAITVGTTHYAAGSNLLSGAFGDGGIAGGTNSSAGGFDVNNENAGSSLSYTSDFVTFAPGANVDAALSMTSILSPLSATTGRALRTFKADAGGSFSADPVPHSNAAPEPASWALMMVGFGLAGATIRRRTRVQAVAA